MSTKVLGPVWDVELPPVQKFVLVCLADNANDEWSAHPSVDGEMAQRSLRKRTGYGASTIRRALDELEARKLILREYRPGKATVYHLNRDMIQQIHFRFEAELRRGRLQEPPPEREGNRSGRATGAVATPSGAGGTPSGAGGEPSRTVKNQKTKDIPHADACAALADEIRKCYPKRDGGQRWADAERALRARLREGHEPGVILAGIARYGAYVTAKGWLGTEHVQQAATFLGRNRGFLESWEIVHENRSGTGGQRLSAVDRVRQATARRAAERDALAGEFDVVT